MGRHLSIPGKDIILDDNEIIIRTAKSSDDGRVGICITIDNSGKKCHYVFDNPESVIEVINQLNEKMKVFKT